MINFNQRPLHIKCTRMCVSVNVAGKSETLTRGMVKDVSTMGTSRELRKSNLMKLYKKKLITVVK